MKHLYKLSFYALAGLMLFAVACSDDEPLPVLGVAFETTAVGIARDATSATINVSLSRAVSVASKLTITTIETGVTTGTDYSTSPTISGGSITLEIAAGEMTASFDVTRLANVIEAGSNVVFTLSSISGDEHSEISGNTSVTVTFDAISSPGSSFTAEIGGATEPNQVYVDFSLNNQTIAERTSWDLGFYSGTEDKVVLNYSTYMMAQPLEKIDMNEVTASDTIGMGSTMIIGTGGTHVFIDHPNRSLDELAIADISAIDGENPVYIVNRGVGPGQGNVDPGSVDVGGAPLGWKKIRILKSGNDYVIQHADIDATTFEEVTVSKSATDNFTYFSFENGADIEVEPAKEKWDIVFTVSSNIINFGFGDGAYGFSDFVLSNRQGGTEVAAVVLETDENGAIIDGQTGYDDFTADDLGSVTFSPDGHTIGSNWRSVFSRTAHAHVYYIVKDEEGNTYKVQFLGLMDEQGNRGNSSLKYELL